MLEGIHRFDARSSLKTWIYQILTNRATTRAQREHRPLPFSSLSDDDEPEVNEAGFRQVIVGLRDIDGWSSREVCDALEITSRYRLPRRNPVRDRPASF